MPNTKQILESITDFFKAGIIGILGLLLGFLIFGGGIIAFASGAGFQGIFAAIGLTLLLSPLLIFGFIIATVLIVMIITPALEIFRIEASLKSKAFLWLAVYWILLILAAKFIASSGIKLI